MQLNYMSHVTIIMFHVKMKIHVVKSIFNIIMLYVDITDLALCEMKLISRLKVELS